VFGKQGKIYEVDEVVSAQVARWPAGEVLAQVAFCEERWRNAVALRQPCNRSGCGQGLPSNAYGTVDKEQLDLESAFCLLVPEEGHVFEGYRHPVLKLFVGNAMVVRRIEGGKESGYARQAEVILQ
jgi:hypothetical protein